MANDVSKRNQIEKELQKKTYDLNERVKELNCLYGISKVYEKQNLSLDQILQEIIYLIPPAWQFPEITCAQLVLDSQIYRTNNYEETVWKQAGDILVNGDCLGILEVCYLEEKPERDEGPFLQEERSLINAIAGRFGRSIERLQAEEGQREALAAALQATHALRESEGRFRIALGESKIVVYEQDRDLRYTWIHNPQLGFTPEGILGKTDGELLLSEDVLTKTWILRKFLAEMNPIEAMEFLVDRMKKTAGNKKFLASMKD